MLTSSTYLADGNVPVALADAVRFLDALRLRDRHRFWADDLSYDAAVLRGVIGHRQVTDADLAALAVEHGGRPSAAGWPLFDPTPSI